MCAYFAQSFLFASSNHNKVHLNLYNKTTTNPLKWIIFGWKVLIYPEFNYVHWTVLFMGCSIKAKN